MNPNRILAIFLILGGITLFIVGMNSSNSIADQVSNTFTGRFTKATTWYIIGGIAMAATGLVLGGIGLRGKSN
jgi:hypothetical protein